MAGNLKEAMQRNKIAAEDLDAALRDCLRHIRARPDTVPDTVVEGRFRLIGGGRKPTIIPGAAKLR